MKSQDKMLSLTSRIQKLAKGLNKFSLSDILQMLPDKEKDICDAIQILEKESVIKKVTETEFLYVKTKNLSLNIFDNPLLRKNSKWLTIDEVCEITGEKRETVRRKCKNKIYESTFEKNGKFKNYLINRNGIKVNKKRYHYASCLSTVRDPKKFNKRTFERIKRFKTEKEQEYFNSLPPYAQKFVYRYITVFKLAAKLRGKELDNFLKRLGEEHPEYKVCYSCYLRYLNLYASGGIKAIVPKYGKNAFKTCIPPDMYEKFKKIYLAPNKYTIPQVVKMLPRCGFDENLIPSPISFKRLLNKEYSQDYIETIKNTPVLFSDLQENEIQETKILSKNKPIFERYIDAAQAFLESIENSHTDTDVCRRGYVLNHLNPYFKDLNINQLTQANINEFESLKLSEGYTAASINRFLSAFTVIMKMNNSDYSHLTFFCNNTVLPTTEKDILRKKEIDNIKENSLAELFILALGINPAELLALEYEDISFKNKTIDINKALVNNKIHKHRKLYKIRKLKLPNILLEKLNSKGSGRIFHNIEIKNYNVLLNTHINLLLKKKISLNIICKQLGIPHLNEFETRFKFLLPQELSDDFEIL